METDEIDPEIAAAMGFASFGAPSKRRKYNHDDAFIAGQDDVTKAAKSGSGANSTALGVRSRVTAEVTQQDGGVGQDQAGQKPTEKEDGKAKGKGKGKKGQPMGLADYISWGNAVPAQPAAQPVAQPVLKQETATTATAPEENVMATTTALTGGDGAASWPQGMPSQEELGALRRGVQNQRGDMAYFMPSFIEDPWKGIVG